jgi:hypothetical protein
MFGRLCLYFTRIEDSKKDSLSCIFGWRTRRIEFCHRNLHVYGAHLVRASVFREAGHRAQALEIRGHFDKMRAIRRKKGPSARN